MPARSAPTPCAATSAEPQHANRPASLREAGRFRRSVPVVVLAVTRMYEASNAVCMTRGSGRSMRSCSRPAVSTIVPTVPLLGCLTRRLDLIDRLRQSNGEFSQFIMTNMAVALTQIVSPEYPSDGLIFQAQRQI
ncbi:hypothetical protein MICRO8M_90091 [Microbacterium sp. 8M]|nr:hypothetical protein MICRO8M_90091 [Microbacterium sp. 8M]